MRTSSEREDGQSSLESVDVAGLRGLRSQHLLHTEDASRRQLEHSLQRHRPEGPTEREMEKYKLEMMRDSSASKEDPRSSLRPTSSANPSARLTD